MVAALPLAPGAPRIRKTGAVHPASPEPPSLDSPALVPGLCKTRRGLPARQEIIPVQINHSNNTGIHVDWTVNITTLGAIILMLCGWAVQVALQGSRISAVEAQNVQQAIANEKLAATVQRL